MQIGNKNMINKRPTHPNCRCVVSPFSTEEIARAVYKATGEYLGGNLGYWFYHNRRPYMIILN